MPLVLDARGHRPVHLLPSSARHCIGKYLQFFNFLHRLKRIAIQCCAKILSTTIGSEELTTKLSRIIKPLAQIALTLKWNQAE